MSLQDYHESLTISANEYSFYALIMAAMRKADSDNKVRLQTVFPWVWAELVKRYDAPDGVLREERVHGESHS